MTSEQFLRVGELYHAAMELAPEARPGFLADACGDEEELRREVESLLLAREQADGFIAGKVAGVVAEMAAEKQNLSLATSLIGRSLSHYQVLSLLGVGGMGEVYLAQDTRLGRKVALKLLPQAFTRDQERLSRFKQEALATSLFGRPWWETLSAKRSCGDRDKPAADGDGQLDGWSEEVTSWKNAGAIQTIPVEAKNEFEQLK